MVFQLPQPLPSLIWTSTLLQRCAETRNLLLGRTIHGRILRTSSFPGIPIFLANHLLNMYLKCSSSPSQGIALFRQIQAPNTITYSVLMSAFARLNLSAECVSLFVGMKRCDYSQPNEFTYVSCVQACVLIEGGDRLLDQFHGSMVKSGFASIRHARNALLSGLIRLGRLGDAICVFTDADDDNDIVLWNAMLAGYVRWNCNEVPAFWLRMGRARIELDGHSFASVLTGLCEIGDVLLGIQVHGQVEKLGWKEESCLGDSLLDLYLQNGWLEEGLKVFDEMTKKDVKSWTMVASGCLRCGEPRKALWALEEMRRTGLVPNKFTFATAFHVCTNATALEEGRKFHGLRIKLGSGMDVCVDNALIDLYTKCGDLDGARSVFESMEERSVVTWTVMIIGCAQNGRAREAVELFDEMVREGREEPNDITFVGILYACGQGGFVGEGWKYFASMSKEYGIAPGEDHYACMVNLLSRVGHMREAEELILAMPTRPSVTIWKTLLSAALIHGDMEIARRASEQALDSDGNDPSAYTLSSNAFAGMSKWENVSEVRDLMENRDVRKVPGSSWV
ncbi:hypothetical protein MLD38_032879 [Melastoma candidum]|uniref:Uncharacterized protein n=1 Tax=Melastoma candidum TaxID=119954 RepID=A0ACB9M6S4_9MYRT|nr:hypothetical protein MLD38_032879 [Melastoma candidum]